MKANQKRLDTWPVLYRSIETRLRAANVVASVAIEHPDWTAKQCQEKEQELLRRWGW